MARYPREPAASAQLAGGGEEEEPITFDYLLKKVVENTTAMTTNSGRRTTAQVDEEPEPIFEVHINDDDAGDRKVAVTTQARVPATAAFTAYEEEKKSVV